MTEFVKKIKRIQEKAGATLKRIQEEMKRQVNKGTKEAEVWKKDDKLSI